MSQAMERFEQWLHDPRVDEETKRELKTIAGRIEEIEDRFYRDLQFGTGGLRGIIGAGTNRINIYTVRRATQGLAGFIRERGSGPWSVVIAYDSRRGSRTFAMETALVLAGNGIKTYLFESLRPTPELSFAVRFLGSSAGVVITASHNPPEYNGYKVYDHTGCQLVPRLARQVTEKIEQTDAFSVRRMDEESARKENLLVFIGEDVDEPFLREVIRVSQNSPASIHRGDNPAKGKPLNIVYTPLHGSGIRLVPRALEKMGFHQVFVVPEQQIPDSEFSTVRSPNPEDPEAFEIALEWARKKDADIVVGTDPDCDRMGAVIKDRSGNYRMLNGNEAGALMVHYLLSTMDKEGRLPHNGAVVKTIVTGEMGAKIAESYNVKVFQTLTGFKYIGEKMNEFEERKDYRFLFGYEESYGYLAGDYARDKDAVGASALLCEMAAYYKRQGKTLLDVLDELHETYGYFMETLESRTFKGKEGQAKMERMMDGWRGTPLLEAAGIGVKETLDYLHGRDGLPPENALKYILSDGSWFCLRPSGTEPKIKVYFGVCKPTKEEAKTALEQLRVWVMARVDRFQ